MIPLPASPWAVASPPCLHRRADCDTGFPINPKMIEQQMEGGAIMGIGSALWEEMLMDGEKVLKALKEKA